MKKYLYVNGDSHTATCYPDSGPTATKILADKFNFHYKNSALPGGSNQRIIRTSWQDLRKFNPAETVVIIGWSSFERTEWYRHGHWHQICGDAHYSVDLEIKELWQHHIDAWWSNQHYENFRIMAEQHQAIWLFHQQLIDSGFSVLFYQGCDTFFFDGCPQQDQQFELPWQDVWVHDPYVKLESDNTRTVENFSRWALNNGFEHTDNRAHFGPAAHQAWAIYLEPWLDLKSAK
jgi:hypothetical protein